MIPEPAASEGVTSAVTLRRPLNLIFGTASRALIPTMAASTRCLVS